MPMAKSRELTWRQAIEQVLKASDEPLRAEEIAKAIASQGLKTIVGATPAATVGAALYTGIVLTGLFAHGRRWRRPHFAGVEAMHPRTARYRTLP
jgi:hypothetical protein